MGTVATDLLVRHIDEKWLPLLERATAALETIARALSPEDPGAPGAGVVAWALDELGKLAERQNKAARAEEERQQWREEYEACLHEEEW